MGWNSEVDLHYHLINFGWVIAILASILLCIAFSTSQDVYAASVITGDGANSKTAFTVTAPIIGLYELTFDIDDALKKLANAQGSLLCLKNDFNLDVGYRSNTFESGVWKVSAVTIAADALIQFDGKGEKNPIWVFNLDAALVVGAGTQFEIINAGAGASVLWNLGGSLSLGDGTSFVGTTFVTGAIAGATSEVSCKNGHWHRFNDIYQLPLHRFMGRLN
jgi:hypothetical protein